MADNKQKSGTGLIEIINAQINDLSTLVTAMDKLHLDKKKMEQLKDVVSASMDVLKIIVKNQKTIEQVTKISINIDANTVSKKLKPIITLITETAKLIEALGSLKLGQIVKINLTLILVIASIVGLMTKLVLLGAIMMLYLPVSPMIALGLQELNWLLGLLSNVFKNIEEINPLLVLFKIPFISLDLDLIRTLMWKICRLQEDPAVIKLAFAGLFELATGMRVLRFLFDQIAQTKLRFVRWKLKLLIKAFRLIEILLWRISRIRVNKGALIKIFMISLIMKGIKIIFADLIIAGLLSVLAILALPIVTLCVLGIWLIIIIINAMKIPKTVAFKILQLILVMSLIIVMAAELAIISILASTISIKSILIFMGSLLLTLVMALAIAGIGLLLTPIFTYVMIGLAEVAIMLGAIVLIALELRIIQELNLDKDRIEKNIHIVMESAMTAIVSVFDSVIDSVTPEKNEGDSAFKTFIRKVLGAATVFVELILSVYALMMTVVAVSIILLIAVVLRGLQELNLDRGKIITNVGIVLDTAKAVITKIFEKPKPIEEDHSNDQDWKKQVVEFMKDYLGAVVTLWQAIASVAILAVTLISVSLILLIATELRILQEIDLKPDQIQNNVNIVINTAKQIAHTIVHGADDQEEDQGNGNPHVRKIIEFFGSVLGGIVNIIDSILAFKTLALAILNVSIVWGIASMLNKIQEIDLHESEIMSKTNAVINCANHIKSVVFHQEEEKSETSSGSDAGKRSLLQRAWGAVKSTAKAVVGVVKGVVDGIGNLAAAGVLATAVSAVTQVAQITEVLSQIEALPINTEAIRGKVNSIIDLTRYISTNVKSSKNNIGVISQTKVELFRDYVDDSIRLMEQINGLDTDKLITYSDMWEKMTEFMDKIKDLDIEAISDAIVNKIAPAMEDISDNVEGMSRSTEGSDTETGINGVAPTGDKAGSGDMMTAKEYRYWEKAKAIQQRDMAKLLEDIKNALSNYFVEKGAAPI